MNRTKPRNTLQHQAGENSPAPVTITGKTERKISGFLPLLHVGSLGPAAQTLATIIDQVDRNGRSTWKAVATLARLAGVSERTCRRHLRQLEIAGFLVCIHRGRTSSVKRLTRPKAQLLASRHWPLPRWALDRGLSWSAKAVLAYLVFFAGDHPDVRTAARIITRQLGLALRSVETGLRELEAAGLVRRTERVGQRWNFQLTAPEDLARAIPDLVGSVAATGETPAPGGETGKNEAATCQNRPPEAEKRTGKYGRAEPANMAGEPKVLLTQDSVKGNLNTTCNHSVKARAGGRGFYKQTNTKKAWRVPWLEHQDVRSPIRLGLLLGILVRSGVVRGVRAETNFWATAARATAPNVRHPGAMLALWTAKPELSPLEYLTDGDDDGAKHLQTEWRAVRLAADRAGVSDDVIELWADLQRQGARVLVQGGRFEVQHEKPLDDETKTRIRENRDALRDLVGEYSPPDPARLPPIRRTRKRKDPPREIGQSGRKHGTICG